jgi:hypothetical protein
MSAINFKPIVYSYTLLKTADTCLYKAYRQYVKRDLPFDRTPEIEWGNKVHEAMEYRIGGKPLPQDMMHWEPIVSAYVDRKAKPEKKTGITKDCKPTGFFDKDVWLRCKIDVTMLNGSNVFLSDFKTGNSRYEDPFELEIQALTLKAAIPAAIPAAFAAGTTPTAFVQDAFSEDYAALAGAQRYRDIVVPRLEVPAKMRLIGAERVLDIEGEVEAQDFPRVTVRMNTERLQVKSKNINNPLGGTDSGITADYLLLAPDEITGDGGVRDRMIVDGWVKTNYGETPKVETWDPLRWGLEETDRRNDE